MTVIRLIVKDTIEEDMFALANTKLALDSEVSKVEQDEISRQNSGTATPVEGEVQDSEVNVIAEKKAKKSILMSLRLKLEATQGASTAAMVRSTSSNSGSGMPAEGTYLQTSANGAVVGAQEIKSEMKVEPS